MDNKHCKDVTEDLFEKEGYDYKFEEIAEPISGVESLAYLKMPKGVIIRKLRKIRELDI